MSPETVRILDVPDEDLEACNIANFERIFGGISATPAEAKMLRGKIAVGFPAYEADPRPNWSIEPIRAFIRTLDAALPHFPYFLIASVAAGQIQSYLLSLIDMASLDPPSYIPRALFEIAKRKSRDVTSFCLQIADDVDRATEPLLLNLPSELLVRDRALAERKLASMRELLIGMQSNPPRNQQQAGYEESVLNDAVLLANLNRSDYRSRDALFRALLAKIDSKR